MALFRTSFGREDVGSRTIVPVLRLQASQQHNPGPKAVKRCVHPGGPRAGNPRSAIPVQGRRLHGRPAVIGNLQSARTVPIPIQILENENPRMRLSSSAEYSGSGGGLRDGLHRTGIFLKAAGNCTQSPEKRGFSALAVKISTGQWAEANSHRAMQGNQMRHCSF